LLEVQFYLIENVVGSDIKLRHNRLVAKGVIEEDYEE